MSLLKTRILTALIIFPATVAAVFLSPSWLFRLIIALVLLIGSWEFRRLADLSSTTGWALQVIQVLLIALMMVFWPIVKSQPMMILGAGCLCWLLMFSRLFTYRDGAKPGRSFRQSGFLSCTGGNDILLVFPVLAAGPIRRPVRCFPAVAGHLGIRCRRLLQRQAVRRA